MIGQRWIQNRNREYKWLRVSREYKGLRVRKLISDLGGAINGV